MKKNSEVSRRTFLKGSAILCAGAMMTGAMAGTGTAQEKKGAQSNTLFVGKHKYAVHEADTIVVGGGMAGLNATRILMQQGVSVIMVDKGPAGHSGNSGVLWGQTMVTTERLRDGGNIGTGFLALDVMGLLNQEQARNIVNAHVKFQPRSVTEQAGNVLQRDDTNEVVGTAEGGITVTHNSLYKQLAQAVIKQGVPVFDNTMMLDLLLDEKGRAAGIVAMNIVDGSAHVFRGKRIILCTGGYHWVTGKTGGGPESTGDAHYALLKKGIKFKDMEMPQYDFCGIHPYGWRPDKEKDMIDIAVTFPVNGEIHSRMFNKNKKAFAASFFADPNVQSVHSFQGALITAAKEIIAGNGTKGDGRGNGILFKTAGLLNEPGHNSYPSYKGIIKYTKYNLNYDFPEYIEVIANEYSSCGVPEQVPDTCESDIPGLYTVFVALSAQSSLWNLGQVYLAAHDMADKVKKTTELPAFSPDDVQASLDRAYGYLDTDVLGGIRASVIHRKIQRAYYKGMDFIKSGETMTAMLKELERIRKEDLPRMICMDKSRVYNRDWKMAMEIEPMLACSLASVHSGLARKESRAPFFRSDYPRMDHDNFLCYLWVSMDKNWNFKVVKGDITDTVMSREIIKKELSDKDPRFDISVPNP